MMDDAASPEVAAGPLSVVRLSGVGAVIRHLLDSTFIHWRGRERVRTKRSPVPETNTSLVQHLETRLRAGEDGSSRYSATRFLGLMV